MGAHEASRRQTVWRLRRLAWTALILAGSARADWTIPAGPPADLNGGAVAMGCTDLRIAGTLIVGAGGVVNGVRSVFIEPGGRIELNGGRIELAQQWNNQGSVNAAGGQVWRVDSPACPAIGPVGPLDSGAFVAVPATDGWALALLSAILGWLGWRNRRRSKGGIFVRP